MEYMAFTVVLEYRLTEAELQPILAAIRQIRGVNDVVPITTDAHDVQLAKNHLKREIMGKIIDILKQ